MTEQHAGGDDHALNAREAALCEALGIEPGYYNIWGEHRSLSPSTARCLLSAFGVDANNEASLNEAVERISDSRWRQMLPPVVLQPRDKTDIDIAVVIDVADKDAPLSWEITTEDNARFSGQIDSANYRLGERRRLGEVECVEITVILTMPENLALGYHRLTIWQHRQARATTRVIVAPSRCLEVPASTNGARYWGLSIQLYALRSARNWGIGDFTDLASLIDIAADFGAALVGVNPLHALNLHYPPTPNPYSPNSRHFLNAMYLDIEAIADFAESGATLSAAQQAELAALQNQELIDYARVIGLKMAVLRKLFSHFRAHHLAVNSARAQAFAAFQRQRSERLRQFAVFEAIKDVNHHREAGTPLVRFDCEDDDALQAFVNKHEDTVLYFEYLQWQSDAQLSACAARANERAMAIGLYTDLAVGCTLESADVWSQPGQFATNVEIGAPADDFSPDGQCWGSAPLRPDTLASDGYQTYIQLLRDVMRHAGAIRIDHVLGLLRLFWVPRGHRASDGAYVRYPLDTLLAITALESQRNQCIVVGEDLGNVPDEIRHALWQWGILSTSIFYFEKYWDGDQSYKIPEHYPKQALTSVGSHDLPTIRGFWEHLDLDILSQLDRFPSAQFAEDRHHERRADRERLLRRLHEAHLDTGSVDPDRPLSSDEATSLALALYTWLSGAPSQLLEVQPEDIFGVREQTNIPGTIDEHPNWRRKLSPPIESWSSHDGWMKLVKALRKQRPHDR